MAGLGGKAQPDNPIVPPNRHRFIVAGLCPTGEWDFAGRFDWETALSEFEKLCQNGAEHYKAAAVFTVGQWESASGRYRRFRNLRDRSGEAIPATLGIWLVNQADAGYF